MVHLLLCWALMGLQETASSVALNTITPQQVTDISRIGWPATAKDLPHSLCHFFFYHVRQYAESYLAV